MEKIIAYEGKGFTVSLQSMIGSTLYGWCLKSMPEGIILTGMENTPTSQARLVRPTMQNFYFGVSAVADKCEVELEFVLASMIDAKDIGNTVKINVLLVPANENEDSFVEYSENSAIYNATIPYGVFPNNYEDTCSTYNSCEKYGYPMGAEDTCMKYGFPNGAGNACMLYSYGYPVERDYPAIKYGYPIGTNDTCMKYGYPCYPQSMMAYGVNNTCPPSNTPIF